MNHVRLWPWCVLLIFSVVFFGLSVSLLVIDPPPMTGHVTSKDCHPAYYPVDDKTPMIYVIGITNGNRGVSWVVSEERYQLYEVGDAVSRLPKFKGEDL